MIDKGMSLKNVLSKPTNTVCNSYLMEGQPEQTTKPRLEINVIQEKLNRERCGQKWKSQNVEKVKQKKK